jgi:hypothetical protein
MAAAKNIMAKWRKINEASAKAGIGIGEMKAKINGGAHHGENNGVNGVISGINEMASACLAEWRNNGISAWHGIENGENNGGNRRGVTAASKIVMAAGEGGVIIGISISVMAWREMAWVNENIKRRK